MCPTWSVFAPFSEFWLHMASSFQFSSFAPGSRSQYAYTFLWMHVTSPSPSPFAFSLGHLAMKSSSYEYRYKCGEKVDDVRQFSGTFEEPSRPWIVLLSCKLLFCLQAMQWQRGTFSLNYLSFLKLLSVRVRYNFD